MGLFRLPDLCGLLPPFSTAFHSDVMPQARRSSTNSIESAGQEWKGSPEGSGASSKRVIVVVDESTEARMALLWALSHIVDKLDLVILLHVMQPANQKGCSDSEVKIWDWNMPEVASQRGFSKRRRWISSLETLCAARLPEAQLQVLLVEGQKGSTIVGQARRLKASIVVLGQRRPSLIWRLLGRSYDKLVEYCIHNSECLTLAVRKKSRGLGGYLINSKWQRNFWLLA
ncbi:hypothetical protein O6H91_10G054200 [Diphasiastrum complanatum]|uniref:Uncharacterized protein n=1 Tax=Diphasiastrum complanatum TaxID=34168 RepID=A0ACC2CH17_DIPCM|nr:hypothetical protein O6H91_Y093500 [Diphasiastrum complanatum]KAJ7541317.1 hypothetical protein O6H91_10G054200 [Diphasiastrum complanatum]